MFLFRNFFSHFPLTASYSPLTVQMKGKKTHSFPSAITKSTSPLSMARVPLDATLVWKPVAFVQFKT